ncbi:hypothetical protein C2845_PM06G11740 [Panicum miliaceum]|uniref:Subtilisin-like protease fibronectin type-III domain-containing protein n=1 Tax=Panicum miliaceum TaxID=4540 RepID=A0A3L6R773_PANMI|nr:hypothetical protein C2845_PM06G11740 [Panicum miliaceum]
MEAAAWPALSAWKRIEFRSSLHPMERYIWPGLNASVWHPVRYLGACNDLLGAQTKPLRQRRRTGRGRRPGENWVQLDLKGLRILQQPAAVGRALKDYSQGTQLGGGGSPIYAKDGDDDYALQDVIRDLSLNRSSLPKVMDFNLNYPSIMVPANTKVQRTLTNVGPADNWYATVAITDGSGVEVDISPAPHSVLLAARGEAQVQYIDRVPRQDVCLLLKES